MTKDKKVIATVKPTSNKTTGVTVSPNCHISTTSRSQVKGNNSSLASIHDANGSFSRLNLNGE
ncbi:hypothetical protein Glove_402g49 [Diversispora epigaea]|uniref:GP-PDE domain-containing protein n=1 Tax=Diversispora epigaea TaxID=1348612 RepID=A0A397H4K4_9GLOM|nr:hypothetical protein Glove_402g49 [Diversispora epigaea]